MLNQSGSYAKPRLDLGVALMEFMHNPQDFIGTRVAPIFDTAKKAATYSAITRESFTRDVNVKRAPRGNYNRDGIETKDKSYACEEYGLEGPLDDSEKALYKSDFDAEMVTVKGLVRKIMQEQEKRISSLVINTSTWTGSDLYTDKSGEPWATASTDVQKHVKAAKTKVRTNCGVEPNALILSGAVVDSLITNDKVRDAIKYTTRLSEQEVFGALAAYFGVQQLLVGKGVRNSAKEGKTFSGAEIWSATYAMLAVIATDGNDLSQPSVARTFLWTEDSAQNAVVEQYRDEQARSEIYRVRHSVDEVVVDPYFAHLLKIA